MQALSIILIKLLFFSSIFFDAKSDAIADDKKQRNHLYDILIIAPLLLSVFPITHLCYFNFYQDWHFICAKHTVCYVLIRIAVFNIIYNLSRTAPRLEWDYVGSSSLYDRCLLWMKRLQDKKFPMLLLYYMTAGTFGFFWY